MVTQLLPCLKKYLAKRCAHLRLESPEPGKDGAPVVRPPRVFIGDFPAKREAGQDAREFPCILLTPVAGYAEGGEEHVDIAAILAVYNPEQGDGEGMEMDLAVLCNTVAHALRACLEQPLEQRFQLERDEKGRTYRWQRSGEPTTPRPYAQLTIISRWMIPNWE